jgi:tetratricopeptide (TPR) repeat protein
MSEVGLVNEFKEGLTALRKGFPQLAVFHLRKAVEEDRANPFYLSFYGLALARMGGQWAKAEDLCIAALRLNRRQAHLYVNLAEVYLRVGQRDYALSTLYNGLQRTRWHGRVVQALELMGIRRQPVISFLRRKHFLNRQLGKLRHRLRGHGSVTALENLRLARS